MEIFTFCSTSQLIFNILLFLKFIQIENIIKQPYICKYENHWNTSGFSMILVILGAQKSPPKTYFFVMIFLKNTYRSKLKTFDFHLFYEEFTSPIHKNHTPKNNEKTNKIQTPLHVTENRPSSKTFVFVTYLPPILIIGRLPGTPPGRPKRSQNLPGELPRPPRALRGLPRTPRTPWEPRNLTEFNKNANTIT